MIKTILIIIISVSIFGIIFFVIVRNALRRRLDFFIGRGKKEEETLIFD